MSTAVDASERFLNLLAGVTDPERKRKIIGNEFIRVFDEEAHRIGEVDFLVQGTLYPDVIESVSVKGPSQTIKSHHNVGGLPERMKLKLVEPLRELFKDEVRRSASSWVCPKTWCGASRFPGPDSPSASWARSRTDGVRMLQDADDILISEIKKAGSIARSGSRSGVLLPVKSVGVMGDIRTYEHTLAIRAVHSTDGMTADWVRLALRYDGRDFQPHRQRSERNQSGRLRHHIETACHHRMGIKIVRLRIVSRVLCPFRSPAFGFQPSRWRLRSRHAGEDGG